jgi:methanethiol S-methyltransferase
MTEAGLLVAAWVLWCGLHSWLARPVVRAGLEQRLPFLAGFYRLLYNLFAAVSLFPLAWWQLQQPPGRPLVVWSGHWKLLQAGGWVAALALFWGGVRSYPLGEFLGLPLRPPTTPTPPPLVTGGVLNVVRHPWYLAALLVIWGRNLDRLELVIALLLSAYLVFGAHLEERRLLKLYGPTYRAYQRQVAAWLPGKPLLRRLTEYFNGLRRH